MFVLDYYVNRNMPGLNSLSLGTRLASDFIVWGSGDENRVRWVGCDTKGG